VSTRQFQVAASLTGSLAVAAPMDVPAIAMPFELWLRNVRDNVVVELSSRLEIAATAMAALLGMNVVFDELGIRRRFGAKDARMLAVFLSPPVLGGPLPGLTIAGPTFTTLQESLDLMFELRDPLPQLGILGFEFGNSSITRVVHDRPTLPKTAILGKSSCLTITKPQLDYIS
jgi:hypothetical protein